MVEDEGVRLRLESEGVVVDFCGGEGNGVGMWVHMVPGWMESIICSKACVGGERWVAIVAESWGCLYFDEVSSLCKVCSTAARKWRRLSLVVCPVKAGL